MLAGKMNDPELVAWVKEIARAACKADFGRLRSKLEALELTGMRGDPQVGIDVLELKKQLNDTISRLEDERVRLREEGPGGLVGDGAVYADTPGHRVSRAHEALELVRSTGKVKITLTGLGLGNVTPMTAVIDSATLGSSTPGILTPDRISPFVPMAQRRLTLRDLIRSRMVESGTVDWVKELTAPDASMQFAEGSPKAETTQTYTVASSKVQTLAAWLTASVQVLDDWEALRRIIDASLLFRLKLREEEQILSGDGTGSNLNGLITQAGAYQGTHDAASDNRADRVLKAFLELQEIDEEPDFSVLNPVDWAQIQLTKSNVEGLYLAQSPIGMLSTPILWGRPVVITNAIASGTFLVGDSRLAEILDRQEANVQISTEHEDYFVRNLVAIRIEERLALAVLRSTAFLKGTFTNLSP